MVLTIYIDDLALKTTIGVLPWEKKIQQTLYLSLELSYDASKAMQTDCIDDALDYAHQSQSILDYCQQTNHQLLESLANNIANLLLTRYPVKQLRLKLRKPQAISGAKDVGVILNVMADASLLP